MNIRNFWMKPGRAFSIPQGRMMVLFLVIPAPGVPGGREMEETPQKSH